MFPVVLYLEICWRCYTAPILCNIKIWHWLVRLWQRLLGCDIFALVMHFSSKHCWNCDADDWMDKIEFMNKMKWNVYIILSKILYISAIPLYCFFTCKQELTAMFFLFLGRECKWCHRGWQCIWCPTGQRVHVTSQSVCETDCRSTAMSKHPDMLLVEAVQID